MTRSIFVLMFVGAIAAAMIASTIVTSYVQADTASDRRNNNLDRHIAAGGAHGAEAQKIKDSGGGPPPPGDS